jgi:hypothetical protein
MRIVPGHDGNSQCLKDPLRQFDALGLAMKIATMALWPRSHAGDNSHDLGGGGAAMTLERDGRFAMTP